MYLHLEMKTIPVTRRTEALNRLGKLHGLMSQCSGFQEAQIYSYLGNPGQFLIVRTWDTMEDHKAYRASDASKAFAASRPEVLPWENYAVQEWDELVRSAGDAKGNFLIRTLQNVGAGSDAVYLDSRRERDALDMKLGGVVDVRTYRPLTGVDDPTEAMVLERRADRAGYDTFLESAASENYETSVAPTLYTNQLIECYELVVEIKV
jgi:heme-degrading monooxygenase HmoA